MRQPRKLGSRLSFLPEGCKEGYYWLSVAVWNLLLGFTHYNTSKHPIILMKTSKSILSTHNIRCALIVLWLDAFELVFDKTGLLGSKVYRPLSSPEDCILCYIRTAKATLLRFCGHAPNLILIAFNVMLLFYYLYVLFKLSVLLLGHMDLLECKYIQLATMLCFSYNILTPIL